MSSIKIYTSKNCVPCKEIHSSLNGKNIENVEIIDIDTDEGFLDFQKNVLNDGDAFVPLAYRDGEKCHVYIDKDSNLTLDCPSGVFSSEIK